MRLSLREARKLETRIQSKINEGVINGRALNIHEAFLGNENLTNGWLQETFAVGDESAATLSSLVSARSDIRREVQATNERVGINSLVSQRKELISLRSIWGDVAQGYDVENGHAMTADVLQRTAATAVDAAKLSTGGYGQRRTDVITVSSISDELHEAAESKIRQLLRDIDQVEDKLAGLNSSTKIELETTLVDFLEEVDLL